SGAKREERIECGSLGGNDAIAWVGATGVTCRDASLKLKGRKGIDIDVAPAVIHGRAERAYAVAARRSDADRGCIRACSVRPVRQIGRAVKIKVRAEATGDHRPCDG